MSVKLQIKLIFIMIVVIVVIFASIVIIDNSDSEERITAMEGYEIANEIAHNWSANASLNTLRDTGIGEKGSYSSWRYHFFEWPPIGLEYFNETYGDEFVNYTMAYVNYCEISIYANGTSQINTYQPGNTSLEDLSFIENWNIDSDMAYEIALEQDQIDRFVGRNSMPFYFGLFGTCEEYGEPSWMIEWGKSGFMDDPSWATIYIGATTGNVLKIEAPM